MMVKLTGKSYRTFHSNKIRKLGNEWADFIPQRPQVPGDYFDGEDARPNDEDANSSDSDEEDIYS